MSTKMLWICDVCEKEYRDRPKTALTSKVETTYYSAPYENQPDKVLVRTSIDCCSLKCLLKARKNGNDLLTKAYNIQFPTEMQKVLYKKG